MINFILEADIERMALAIFNENIDFSSIAQLDAVRNSYLNELRTAYKSGVPYKVEVNSVFVGVYVIDFGKKNILFKKIRKTKLIFEKDIDNLLLGYFNDNLSKNISSNSLLSLMKLTKETNL